MARSLSVPIVALLAAAALVPAQPPTGRQFALLVGVTNYRGTELGDLKYAEKDAADLAAVLREANYRRVVLMTRTEGFDKKDDRLFPKAKAIRKQVQSLLEDARDGDTVVLGFSGHGATIKGQPGLFFCPEEADLTDRNSLVSLTEVQDALKACKATVKVLIADACRNEVTAGKAPLVEGLASATRPELPKPPAGVVTLFSCSAGQKSFESPKHQRGFLFHHVIEGLQGKAADAKGEVTLSRLVSFAVDEVPLAVKDEFLDANQRPEMLGEIGGRVPLVRAVERNPKTLTVDLGGVSMEFVRIPKGDFLRGAPDGEADALDHEKPQKRITISQDFYLGKYEVTQEQYRALTGESPSWFSATGGGKDKVAGLDTARFPVEQVTHADALAFCAKLKAKTGRNATLPSEAQWEYACRARTATPFHFGTTLNGDKANCDGNYPYGGAAKGTYLERTCQVGRYPANAFGLCDMHGNVWEWCLDWYDAGYYKTSATVDPICTTGEQKYRVLRGGSWGDIARDCRAANRNWNVAAYRYDGFRVAFRLD